MVAMSENNKFEKKWFLTLQRLRAENPDWFYFHLQEVMKCVFLSIEGVDEQGAGGEEIFDFEDMYDWASNRAHLLQCLEQAILLFRGSETFREMSPSTCANKILQSHST